MYDSGKYAQPFRVLNGGQSPQGKSEQILRQTDCSAETQRSRRSRGQLMHTRPAFPCAATLAGG